MQNRMIWFERKFSFDFPVEIFPMIVERLRGMPLRLEQKLASMPARILTSRIDNGWTIQEQAGHLVVVESLWIGRLDDFLAGERRLRPADLTNSKTKNTDFNSQPIESILAQFESMRSDLVERLYQLSLEQAGLVALHPRLDQPMRLIDAFYFAAEHDDHHLSRMTDISVLSD